MKFNKLTCRCVTNSVPGMFTGALLLWTFFTEYIVTLPDLFTIYGRSASTAFWVVVLGVIYLVLWLGAFGNFIPCVLVDNSPSAHFDDAVRRRQLAEESGKAELLGDFEEGRGGDSSDHHRHSGDFTDSPLDPESFLRCRKCSGMKPPRAHHCSVCNKCCLKMDHHCPWIGNCVGFYNYKFFVNFLLFSVVLCFFVLLNSIPAALRFMSFGKAVSEGSASIAIIILSAIHGMVGLAFFISVQFLLYFHMKLVTVNSTTLESDNVTK